MTTDAATVLVAVPQPLFRRALSEVLSGAGLHVSVAATDAEARVRLADAGCTVALVDAKLPENGLGLLRDITETSTDVATCLLVDSGDATDQMLLAAVNAGVDGVLSKAATPDEFIDGVQRLAAGDEAYDRFTAARLVEVLRPGDERRARFARLSRRERQVLEMIAQGYTTVEIAERLYISRNTVKGIVADVFARLEVSTRAAAVAAGFRLGLLS